MALGSQPLNYPTQPLNYGNFVPNYSLGGVEPPPVFWDEGEAEEEEELEIAPPARVHRQQDHVVSDEEDNVVVVPQVQGANLAPACQRVTSAVAYHNRSAGYHCLNYIDDFCGAHANKRVADEGLYHFTKKCQILGLQLAPEKNCNAHQGS